MADNTVQNGTDNIATDDLATINGGAVGTAVKVARSKTGFGSDGDFRDVDSTHGLPVTIQASGSANITSPAIGATSSTALASNAARRGASFFNDSNVDVLLSLGSTPASSTSYSIRVFVNSYYELPYMYTGQLTMIGVATNTTTVTASATGGLRVTELT